MWPRMLLDLLPHFARLVPVADKYLAGRNANDKAQSEALAALGGDLRGQMGRVTEAQSGIDRQLQQQSAQIAEIAVDVTRARMGVESVEARVGRLELSLAAMEKKAGIVIWLLSVVLVLTAATLALVVVRMVR